MNPLAVAYSATGAGWRRGPSRIYDPLARRLVARSPVPLGGRLVLDLGAGTGAASRALAAEGARALAVDAAVGMLAVDRAHRPACVVGDATALPLRAASVDAVVAAFSLNHLTDPAAGLREAARVTRPGGVVLGSSYAADDGHPVKAAVEEAAAAEGWSGEGWMDVLRSDVVPRMATVERARSAAAEAGLDAEVAYERVAFPELDGDALVEWRLGMAQLAPFVARLDPVARARLKAGALSRLGARPPVLHRSVIWLTARVDSG